MSYNYRSKPTPNDVRQLLLSAGINLNISFPDDLMTGTIDEVVGDLEHRVRRQFVPGCAGEVRYYDGSSTGVQVIDEYISVSNVEILVTPDQGPLPTPITWYEIVTNGKPKTKLGVLQGPPNFPAYWSSFPPGRSNIKVTAQFGYAETIPAEVWMAILKESAGRIADGLAMTTRNDSVIGGRIISWTEADVQERYADQRISEALGWHQAFESVCKDHIKSPPRRARRLM